MTFKDLEAMALGALKMSIAEFQAMTFRQVIYRMVTNRWELIKAEEVLRRAAFYQLVSQGVKVGNMPLRNYWQVWEIPEIDGDIKERTTGKVRRATDEELKLLKERPAGWQKRLIEMRKNDD